MERSNELHCCYRKIVNQCSRFVFVVVSVQNKNMLHEQAYTNSHGVHSSMHCSIIQELEQITGLENRSIQEREHGANEVHSGR